MEERRNKNRDAVRRRVSALHADLLAMQAGNCEPPHLRQAVAALAVQARKADVPPERLLISIKRLVDGLALEHLGLWYRLTLGERFVQWAIASYYEPDDAV
jgi:hypothetical protein